MSDDTRKSPSDTVPTPPALPASSADEQPPIPAGQAQAALAAALDVLADAVVRVEAIGMACARQRDAEATR
jgi:hypothetical protein